MNKKTIISMVLGWMSRLPASAQNGWFVEAGGGVQTIFYIWLDFAIFLKVYHFFHCLKICILN